MVWQFIIPIFNPITNPNAICRSWTCQNRNCWNSDCQNRNCRLRRSVYLVCVALSQELNPIKIVYNPSWPNGQLHYWTLLYNIFYARQLYRQVLLRARISYGISVRPSVCLSVRPSQPGGIPSTGEIETPGLHHMVAWSI